MARLLLKDSCALAAEILDGKHDADLANISHACAARIKMRFRKGAKVRLVGTKNPRMEGEVGVILKVNTKTVIVGCGTPETDEWGTTWSKGEYNVPPAMLEAVAA